MNGTGVIDQFLNIFTTYIDSGFGLLGGEVGFIATTLIVIDVTLAALFWSWGADEDIMARLVKKTLFVGAFAYLINNWNNLANIIFQSFSGLGLKASGSSLSASQFLQPGRIAQVGLDAGRPLLTSISGLMGYVSFFENFIQIAVLLFAWVLVLLAFFILAIQLFVTLIEFKLTTLAGFVLIPFGLFGKSAFMAERVLGNVIASGIKVLVLAIIVGIGSTLFTQFTAAGSTTASIDDAMAIVLAALSLLGLGIFGPGIANGLVSGGPQLGAGAAVGTALAGGGVAAAGFAAAGAAASGGAALASGAGAAARGGASLAGGASAAYGLGAEGKSGARAVASGLGNVAGTGAKQVSFDKVAIDKARDYAAEDADVTMQLWALFKPRLAREHMVGVYETLERPLIPVLIDMERAGIKVDAPLLKRLSADFEKRMADLEREIHKIAGREFNVGSPKQLGEILFDEQKLPGGKRNKNGSWATDVSILEELAAQGHALPVKIMEHRQIAKLKGTYTDALVRQLDARTGRVHTSYHMTGAATGRLASTDPNLQNIPVRTEEGRKIREAFIAEKGHKLLSADYSQIELRLLAHVADIASLKEAFARGDDIHAITASEMFGVPVAGMDPLVRRRAKAINFGIIYGISAFGLAQQLGIGQPEARDYIAKYFQRYPGIRDYMESTKEYARKNGFVKTPFGRKIHLRFIADRSQGMRAFAERAAINAPLQGGAADIIKKAMIRLPAALGAAKLHSRMLLQVHDELLFEVPEAEVDRLRDVARGVMEGAAKLSVPLVVDTGVGDNWATAH